jgi:hypothetical protein
VKNISAVLLLFLLLHKISFAQFPYLSPVPGSGYHNPDRTIILRNGSDIDASSINKKYFSITGSVSGKHQVEIILADDNKTIILDPAIPFAYDETVMVTVRDGIRKSGGTVISGCSFSFQTRQYRTQQEQLRIDSVQRVIFERDFGAVKKPVTNTRDLTDFPTFSVDVNTNPAPGNIFYYNFNFYEYPSKYICIMKSNGDSVYSQKTSEKGNTFDLNENGYITVFNYVNADFEMWDSSYNLMGSYKAGNGYETDAHDFLIFSDGHSFLLAYDPQVVDMTVYDSTWQPNATVMGAILQELDSDKNVIFEWRSWDHVAITEAQEQNLAGLIIDCIHPNAIERDIDGNILLSCRVLNQVLKINPVTGDVIWRLGGEKNDFTFVNDSAQFNYQHDIRRLPNGNITIFDNGNYHVPGISSVKEYQLDETAKVATLVWSYAHPYVNGEPVVSWAMGNAQRLSNGNTFINWGYIPPGSGFPNFTEVDNNGTIVWELHFTDSIQSVVYRAHRYEWDPCIAPVTDSLSTNKVSHDSAMIYWSPAEKAVRYLIQYQELDAIDWDTLFTYDGTSAMTLTNLKSATTYEWRVQSLCDTLGNVSAFSNPQKFTTLPLIADTIDLENAVSIYPNPAHDFLYFFVRVDEPVSFQITMMNLLGQEVYEQGSAAIKGEQTFIIPLKAFLPGMYIIKMLVNNKEEIYTVIIE